MQRHENEASVRRPRATLNELLARARARDNDAAQELFTTYAHHFVRVIRQKLAPRLRTLFDPDDFLQETRLELHTTKFLEACTSVDAFVAYLTGIAENLVLETNRKYLDYQRHNLRREVSLDTLSNPDEHPVASCPNACELLIEKEEWERLLRDQPILYRQTLGFLRQGCTQREVADLLQTDERHVRRIVAKVAKLAQSQVQ